MTYVRNAVMIAWLAAWLAVGSAVALAANAGDDAFHFPTLGVSSDSQAMLLGIDDGSLPLKKDLCLYLSDPEVRKEPVLTPSRDNPKAPDHLATHFYGTVLEDGGRFRIWYYAVHYGDNPADLKQGPLCYAESEDGIHWRKPNLGQLELKGSSANNALKLPSMTTQMAGVIKNESTEDPDKKYIMAVNILHGTWVVRIGYSPDGIHWTFEDGYATSEFIEMSSFYKHNGFYVANGQSGGYSVGGHPRGRQGYAFLGTAPDHWLKAKVEAFTLPEPAAPGDRGNVKPYDQVHLGVGGMSYGNVVVGLYGMWHNFPGDTSRDVPASWFAHGIISCDLGLVVSNNGYQFREPVKHHVYIDSKDSAVTPIEGKDYPTILCQSGNGIVNTGDETRIYHGRWRNAEYGEEYYGEVALATLPRDRWGALGLFPNSSEGWVWSAPVTLPEGGCQVVLNADGASTMRVEIARENFAPLTAFSGANSGVTEKDGGLDCPVAWPKGDFSELGGKTVRLRVRMAKAEGQPEPKLYAIYLRRD